jgi:hypothetical protein
LIPGVLLLLFLGPAYLLVVFWLVPKTLGFSLLLPALFIAIVAYQAFHLNDAREHPGVAAQTRQTLAKWTGLFVSPRARSHPTKPSAK